MDILVHILFGFLMLFVQPLLYLMIGFAIWMGYRRVKKERTDFHVCVHRLRDELIEIIFPSLLFGSLLSIIFVGIGIALTPGMMVWIAVFNVLAMLTFQLRLVAPVFTVGTAILAAYFLPTIHSGIGWADEWIRHIKETSPVGVALLLGILLFSEGMLIYGWGMRRTSPRRLNSKRGRMIGAHAVRKFWIVPVFIWVPGGVIPNIGLLHWLHMTGDGRFSLLMVPFSISISVLAVGRKPERAAAAAATKSILCGMVIAILAVFSLYNGREIFAVGAVALGLLFHIGWYLFKAYDRRRVPYFHEQNEGLTVLGVLPGSPAEKMGIQVGECIRRVNGKSIREEKDFYRALQINATFCRIERVDENGEACFVRSALYEGEHHELGLLFVAPSNVLSG